MVGANEVRLLLARKMRIPNTIEWDPFSDANDTEAVIHALNDAGYWVKVEFREELVCVEAACTERGLESLDSQNWKRAICELALKLLETV